MAGNRRPRDTTGRGRRGLVVYCSSGGCAEGRAECRIPLRWGGPAEGWGEGVCSTFLLKPSPNAEFRSNIFGAAGGMNKSLQQTTFAVAPELRDGLCVPLSAT